jgi:hypothetical protein
MLNKMLPPVRDGHRTLEQEGGRFQARTLRGISFLHLFGQCCNGLHFLWEGLAGRLACGRAQIFDHAAKGRLKA